MSLMFKSASVTDIQTLGMILCKRVRSNRNRAKIEEGGEYMGSNSRHGTWMQTRVLTILLANVVLLASASTSRAAAFYVAEAGASPRNGVAVAGAAALADDATTAFYNPAGMSQLDGAHFLLGSGLALVSTRFSADAGTSPNLAPGGNGGQAGGLFPIFAVYSVYDPSSHFDGAWAKRVRFGVGSVTMAAEIDYDGGWAAKIMPIGFLLNTIIILQIIS